MGIEVHPRRLTPVLAVVGRRDKGGQVPVEPGDEAAVVTARRALVGIGGHREVVRPTAAVDVDVPVLGDQDAGYDLALGATVEGSVEHIGPVMGHPYDEAFAAPSLGLVLVGARAQVHPCGTRPSRHVDGIVRGHPHVVGVAPSVRGDVRAELQGRAIEGKLGQGERSWCRRSIAANDTRGRGEGRACLKAAQVGVALIIHLERRGRISTRIAPYIGRVHQTRPVRR